MSLWQRPHARARHEEVRRDRCHRRSCSRGRGEERARGPGAFLRHRKRRIDRILDAIPRCPCAVGGRLDRHRHDDDREAEEHDRRRRRTTRRALAGGRMRERERNQQQRSGRKTAMREEGGLMRAGRADGRKPGADTGGAKNGPPACLRRPTPPRPHAEAIEDGEHHDERREHDVQADVGVEEQRGRGAGGKICAVDGKQRRAPDERAGQSAPPRCGIVRIQGSAPAQERSAEHGGRHCRPVDL